MMSSALQERTASRGKQKSGTTAPGDYAYISGLTKALELRLLDQARMNRLLEAEDADDISRILLESAYPPGSNPEDMLRDEATNLFIWLRKHMPDDSYVDALLTFHDGHNLKLVLKKLLMIWVAAKDDQTLAEQTMLRDQSAPQAGEENGFDSLPDFGAADGIPPPGEILPLAQMPAQVEPARLYHLVAEHRLPELPDWIGQTASEAIRHYMHRYDLGEIDLFIDQRTWQQAHKLAGLTENEFFQNWLRCRTDLVNLDLLLRTRLLRSGQRTLERALISGGRISAQEVQLLYSESEEAVKAFYANTPYAELADLGRQYSKPGQAARFGRVVDNLLMDQLRTARWVVSGPEVPLAWVLARLAEIKNIRIILTCLRNGLPRSMAQDLIRDGYLLWR